MPLWVVIVLSVLCVVLLYMYWAGTVTIATIESSKTDAQKKLDMCSQAERAAVKAHAIAVSTASAEAIKQAKICDEKLAAAATAAAKALALVQEQTDILIGIAVKKRFDEDTATLNKCKADMVAAVEKQRTDDLNAGVTTIANQAMQQQMMAAQQAYNQANIDAIASKSAQVSAETSAALANANYARLLNGSFAYKSWANRGSPGFTIATYSVGSAEEMKRLCDHTAGCTGFNLNTTPANGMLVGELKAAVGLPSQLTTLNNITVYAKQLMGASSYTFNPKMQPAIPSKLRQLPALAGDTMSLAVECDADPLCAGYTTDGYLWSRMDPLTQNPDWATNPSAGVYVNNARKPVASIDAFHAGQWVQYSYNNTGNTGCVALPGHQTNALGTISGIDADGTVRVMWHRIRINYAANCDAARIAAPGALGNAMFGTPTTNPTIGALKSIFPAAEALKNLIPAF